MGASVSLHGAALPTFLAAAAATPVGNLQGIKQRGKRGQRRAYFFFAAPRQLNVTSSPRLLAPSLLIFLWAWDAIKMS